MPTVTELYRYPVKSLGGERLDAAEPLERGFRDDRRWMFVDAGGTFVSQRSQRRMAKYRAAVQGEAGLAFYRVADGARVATVAEARPRGAPTVPVEVWGTHFLAAEVSFPERAALTEELGLPGARLVYMNEASRRPTDPEHARRGEEVSFADGFPYLLVTEESLGDLAARYGAQLDVRRFRPNIVVAGVGEPFAEDAWDEFAVGAHRFYNALPCARCGVITHDPDTGEVDRGVQRALSSFRRAPGGKLMFGINLCWEGGEGGLRIGDALTVLTDQT